ncbi:MAG: type II and III secretion system protein family protein [Candidatus Melainabacteria bacterium]
MNCMRTIALGLSVTILGSSIVLPGESAVGNPTASYQRNTKLWGDSAIPSEQLAMTAFEKTYTLSPEGIPLPNTSLLMTEDANGENESDTTPEGGDDPWPVRSQPQLKNKSGGNWLGNLLNNLFHRDTQPARLAASMQRREMVRIDLPDEESPQNQSSADDQDDLLTAMAKGLLEDNATDDQDAVNSLLSGNAKEVPVPRSAAALAEQLAGTQNEPIMNLLSAGQLDQLEEPSLPSTTKGSFVSVPKGAAAPNATGGVTILKSGISTSVNEIDVTIGKAVILNLSKPAARVALSNPEVASVVMISPTQIQLVGNAVGVANLLVWGNVSKPDHSVVDINVHRDVSVLLRQLKFVDPGIELVPLAAEDSVILTGTAHNRESAQLAVELARAFFKGASTGGGGGAGASGGGGANASAPFNSETPGSALPKPTPQVINLIKVAGEPSTKVEVVRNRLRDIDPNIKLDIVPGPGGEEKAILTGLVRTASMISKAINTVSIFYGQPGIKVITGPGGNAIRAAVGDNNFQTDTAFNSNLDTNVLQGSVMTDNSGNVVSLLQVAFKPQIRCKVQFLEISKNDLDALGHTIMGAGGPYGFASTSGSHSPAPGNTIASVTTDDSGTAYAAGFNRNTTGAARNTMALATGFSHTFLDGVTQVISINEQFAAAISALEDKRKVRSLAEPTMTMLSGEKSSFLAGGEVPIPVLGSNGQIDVEYREFGIRLNLVATYQDNGKVHMQVAPEVSYVDPANGVSTPSVVVPGFKTRRMQSTLEIGAGQSLIMAGLYSQDDVSSISGTPYLSRLPVLGSFFRNKWKTKASSEMVVIITPTVEMLPNEGTSVAQQ